MSVAWNCLILYAFIHTEAVCLIGVNYSWHCWVYLLTVYCVAAFVYLIASQSSVHFDSM